MTGSQVTKVALVTGGSRGLGKDIALSLARIGVGVVLTYHSNKQEGDRVVDTIRGLDGKAVALQFDVSRVSFFDAFLEQLAAARLKRALPSILSVLCHHQTSLNCSRSACTARE